MSRIRREDGWTLQMLGDKYGVSRQRVQQIIGSTGRLARFYNGRRRDEQGTGRHSRPVAHKSDGGER